MARLFISHSSRNNDRAIALRDWLAAHGWDDVFLDLDPHAGLAPGEHWQQALRAAAYRCQAVLCLITPEWATSPWCMTEFLVAKQLGKCVFPIIAGEVDMAGLPSDLTASHQAVDVVHDPKGWQRLREGLKRAGLDPESFMFAPGRRPYPGFEPLVEEDAAIFFGREAQIVRGLDRIRSISETGTERMLVILGASGAGKSSYLRAGLCPRLKRDDRNFVVVPTIRPERNVLTGKFGLLAALEQAVGQARSATPSLDGIPLSRASLDDLIRSRSDGLFQVFAALRAARVATLTDSQGKPPSIVIAIDQAEELFNEEGRREADAFMALLAETMSRDPRVVVILSIRSEAFPRLQMEALLDSIGKVPFDLPPLPLSSMRLAIEGPARVAQPPIQLDPELVEALLTDANGEDTLPLLAFTLGRLLQDYGAEGRLTLDQYDRLGRINGAVNATVSEMLERGRRGGLLPRDKQGLDALLRETFIPHLARVDGAGRFVRRVATKEELATRLHPLLDLFVEARLLLRDRRVTREGDADIIEVAHEALLREWPVLRSWLEADREFLIFKDKLAGDIRVWQAAGPGLKRETLLSGLALSRARQWQAERSAQDFSRDETAFIDASIKHADASSRRRRVVWIAAACILLGITGAAIRATILAVRGQTEAASARLIAEDRLGLARTSAEELVRLLATDLRNVQGIQVSTLERLLTVAKASFDKLSAAVGDDPAFQKYRASMMSEFGATYLKNKGLKQAAEAYSESLAIYRDLAERQPERLEWDRDIATQTENLGLVQQMKGDARGAADRFRESLTIRRAIAERVPNAAASYRDIADSYYDLAEAQMLWSEAEALPNHREALHNVEHALSLTPDDKELAYIRSILLVGLGVNHQALGRPDEAESNILQALAIRQRLVEANPDNTEWKRMLSWAYSWLGTKYLDDGDPDRALKNFGLCLSLRQSLLAANPSHLGAKYDLAWAHHLLGVALLRQGDGGAAERNFTQAFKLRTQLTDIDETNAKWRKDLALSHEALGDLAHRRKDEKLALERYDSAAKLLTSLVDSAPKNRSWRELLANDLFESARIRACRKDLAGGFDGMAKALAMRTKLLAEKPDTIAGMIDVAATENAIGTIVWQQGSTEEALAHFRVRDGLRDRILARSAETPKIRNDFAAVQKRFVAFHPDAPPVDEGLGCKPH